MNKKTTLSALFFVSLLAFSTTKGQEVGTLPNEKKVGNLTYRKKLHYVCDQASYINGGITFNYPSGTFSTPPMVNVSIKLTDSLDADVTWSPVIVSSTHSGVTVGVTRSSSTEHREATTNEVEVTIYAIGQP